MEQKVSMKEVSVRSVSQIIDILTKSYVKMIKDGTTLSRFPSVFLWGQPGVGKSQAVKQICENIRKQTGKKVVLKDMRLIYFNPVDLRGIPVASKNEYDQRVAEWLVPEVLQLSGDDNVVNVLFLDELSAAPQSVQAAAYQLTLDRCVAEHKLPDNTIVIAAGNRVTDKSVAFKMPKALGNRLLHFDVTTNFEKWVDWAVTHIHPLVVGFLHFRSNYLNTFDPSNDSLAFCTPRSWEMVSNILYDISDNVKEVYDLICGLIGSGVASEFLAWSKMNNLPKVTDIFNGVEKKVPSDPSVQFAVVCSMVGYMKDNDIPAQKVLNSLIYSKTFSKDFLVLYISQMLSLDPKIQAKLNDLPEFSRLLNTELSFLNGRLNGFVKSK